MHSVRHYDTADEVSRERRGPTTARVKVLVVLPAYNEEHGIGRLLTSIDEALGEAGLDHEIIVVDDGSSDQTAAILADRQRTMSSLVVATHHGNKGLGVTIRDGLRVATERAGARDVIVTMDADETHLPGLIPRMVQMIREGHDVVIASRYQRGSRVIGLSPVRKVLSLGASMLIRWTFPIPGVRDYTCGFRAYRAPVLQAAFRKYGDRFVDQAGFQCMVEILLKLINQELLFGEAPMILRYDLKQGESKMKVAKTISATLALLVKQRFVRT
jgi:dolichol-phosphate mannosyltransferase